MSKIIVMLEDDAIFDEREDLIENLEAAGFQVEQLESLPNLLIVPGLSVETFPFKDHEGIKSLEDDAPRFRLEAVREVTVQALPTSGPWPMLRHIHRDSPWGRMTSDKLPYTASADIARDGTGVDFYIVDTGIRPTHEQFEGRATAIDGWTPLHWHGTACASMGCGKDIGFAKGSLVWMAAGLRNADNTGSTADLLTAINACLTHYNGRASTDRPAVLSMSFSNGWTSGSGSDSYNSSLQSCMNAGIVCVAAAANDQQNIDTGSTYPAKTPGVICVGGVNMDDGPYSRDNFGTNYGLSVDILAGSQNCYGADTVSDTAYRSGNGTSFGTPYVAGAIACMLQGYRRLTTTAQVAQVGVYVYNQATFGRYKPDARLEPMTPAILYLDPGAGPYPAIPSLVAKT